MPKYQSEFPQYVISHPDENNCIEVEANRSTRFKQLKEKNEVLRKELAIFSRKAHYLQIENAKLLKQNKQLKRKSAIETCIAVSAFSCLVAIVYAAIINAWN